MARSSSPRSSTGSWRAARKSVAEDIVYSALDQVGEKTSRPPVEVLEQAVKTVTPVLEVRSRRVGGANYQVPVEVPPASRTYARRALDRHLLAGRRERHMSDKLANEILDALNQQGGAFKHERDASTRMRANKAFARLQ